MKPLWRTASVTRRKPGARIRTLGSSEKVLHKYKGCVSQSHQDPMDSSQFRAAAHAAVDESKFLAPILRDMSSPPHCALL